MKADEQQRQIARVKESKAQELDKQKRLERERKIASEKAARELASKEARDKRDEEFRTRAAGSTQMTSVVADKLKHLVDDGCRGGCVRACVRAASYEHLTAWCMRATFVASYAHPLRDML